jgi:hypothetical protein
MCVFTTSFGFLFLLNSLLADDKTCNHTIYCTIGNTVPEKAIQVILDLRETCYLLFSNRILQAHCNLFLSDLQPEDKVLSLPLTNRSWHRFYN